MYPVRFTPLTAVAACPPGPARPAAGCTAAGRAAAADAGCAPAPDAKGTTAAVRPMARLLTGVLRTSWESFRMVPPRGEFVGKRHRVRRSRLGDQLAAACQAGS